MRLLGLAGLSTELGGGGLVEEAGEDGLEEGAEDELSAAAPKEIHQRNVLVGRFECAQWLTRSGEGPSTGSART